MATQYTAGLSVGQVLTAATMNSIGAAWETWTPAVVQSGAVTSTNTASSYMRIQKLVIAQAYVTITGTGTGANVVTVSLPVTAKAGNNAVIAFGWIYDSSTTTQYTVMGQLPTTTTISFLYSQASGSAWGVAPNIALAANDQIRFTAIYEAA